MASRTGGWDPRTLPDLTGRTYLVTGSNAGLGYFASEQLARAGAHVIMTGRNPNRLAAARAAVHRRWEAASDGLADSPNGRGPSVETLLLDTSNRGSIRAAAATVRNRSAIDGLLLNAGIVHPPRRRQTTPEGDEVVFATNVLGHFDLAGELLVSLATARGRMVWVGSLSTSIWRYDPVDPQLDRDYTPWRAYVQSKIAATALGLEADRRLTASGVAVSSVVAHPGYSTGGRTAGIRGVNEPSRGERFLDNLQAPLTQSKERGARVLVRALVDPAVGGGEYWGPRFATRGEPRRTRPSIVTDRADVAERLWRACEEATGVRWPFDEARTVTPAS